MTTAQAALVISIIALLVSTASLGWNIYKEVGLRGRVKVSLNVVEQFIKAEARRRRFFSRRRTTVLERFI